MDLVQGVVSIELTGPEVCYFYPSPVSRVLS